MSGILIDKIVDNYNYLSTNMHNIIKMLDRLIDINVDKYIVNDYILYSRHISFINVIRYTSLNSIIHILIDIIKCWTFKVVTDENKFKFQKHII